MTYFPDNAFLLFKNKKSEIKITNSTSQIESSFIKNTFQVFQQIQNQTISLPDASKCYRQFIKVPQHNVLFHLVEIIFFYQEPGFSSALLQWLNKSYPFEIDHVIEYSYPTNHPEFWPLIYKTILRGDFISAISLLFLVEDSTSKRIIQLLKTMPNERKSTSSDEFMEKLEEWRSDVLYVTQDSSNFNDLVNEYTNILGILNLAKIQQPLADPHEYFDMIESCVNKMDSFIHKIIEYYKGIRLDEVNEEVDMKAMFIHSIELCNMQNPHIVFDVEVDQPVTFSCDAFRLSLILNNLISNAVKYQRRDEAHPMVKLTARVAEKEARILIEDNGVGIIEEHVNKIFQIFFRSTDFKNGLGIGLYIVKEALTRIGGEIFVKSEFGKGSTFTLIVPNQQYNKE